MSVPLVLLKILSIYIRLKQLCLIHLVLEIAHRTEDFFKLLTYLQGSLRRKCLSKSTREYIEQEIVIKDRGMLSQ